jgi:hypothetical protein
VWPHDWTVHGVPPMVMMRLPVSAPNDEPVIVTMVPPTVEPVVGDMAEMDGAT